MTLPEPIRIRACCDCVFEIQLIYKSVVMRGDYIEKSIWMPQVCENHRKEMRDKFVDSVGGMF